MIRVGIVGREPLERAGIRRVLESDSRIRFVGEASEAESRTMRTARLDVLVSSHTGTEEALDNLRLLKAAGPRTTNVPASSPAHVVLVDHLSEHITRVLLHQGARGVLLRGNSVRHLPWAVRAAAAGTVALGPVAAQFLVDQYVRPGRTADAVAAARGMLEKLSSREREIVQLLADGVSNPDMAETLGSSTHTVKDHIRGAYTKLGVDNRVQASRIVWQAHVHAQPQPTSPQAHGSDACGGLQAP
ncbi:response regulator transcription factor [Streptomyces coelicoflavus]|uniref:response regulator transcription factor n=1 Tax=Streptomyces coelicoflavus TaxID=285562 RepID=UPI0024AE0A68|nr:response regulator transcription factor [Streptomyces coelicoflavus]MDI6514725.1 response regulator transcription factor [Streptomyces coelicoflavus]